MPSATSSSSREATGDHRLPLDVAVDGAGDDPRDDQVQGVGEDGQRRQDQDGA